jgi:hypothetical protein
MEKQSHLILRRSVVVADHLVPRTRRISKAKPRLHLHQMDPLCPRNAGDPLGRYVPVALPHYPLLNAVPRLRKRLTKTMLEARAPTKKMSEMKSQR